VKSSRTEQAGEEEEEEEEEKEEEEHQQQQGEHALQKMSPRCVLLLAFVFMKPWINRAAFTAELQFSPVDLLCRKARR
jgi:hypothetical protein